MPNALYDLPTLGPKQEIVPERNALLDFLMQANYGGGHGLANQLGGLLDLIQHPVQSAQGMYQAVSHPMQTANALADYAKGSVASPMAFAQFVGENVGPGSFRNLAKKGPPISEMTAYHGSPHKFDKFDSTKIGTGEGAQAYGHGLYFAEDPKVAGSYARTLSNRDMSGYANAHMNAQNIVEKVGGDAAYAAEAIR
jgi:hypothetical protein